VNRKTASNLPHLAPAPESIRADPISGHGPLQPVDERARLRLLREVTTLLMQAGIDPGVTDLLWLPGMEATGQKP